MNITDETLSAFLDYELPEHEMQAVRERLQTDPQLSDRLEQLVMVDQTLSRHYTQIDDQPLPQGVIDLLAQAEKEVDDGPTTTPETGRVLPFRRPAKPQQSTRRPVGIAIAAALVMALGLVQLLGNDTDEQWQNVASALEAAPGGSAQPLADGRVLLPRLTFENQHGEYCRQYGLQGTNSASENIACRTAGGWNLVAEHKVEQAAEPSGYQTASGGSVLDDTLDQMMVGPALTVEKERGLIDQGWAK